MWQWQRSWIWELALYLNIPCSEPFPNPQPFPTPADCLCPGQTVSLQSCAGARAGQGRAVSALAAWL